MKKLYSKKGQVAAIGAIIALVVGLAVATLIQIFTGVLGGQTYQLTEAKIDAITNTTIKQYIKDSVVAGFNAQKQNAEFMPIVGLAVLTAVILSLFLGFTNVGGMGGRGSAL